MSVDTYLELVNSENFRKANRLVHEAEDILVEYGMNIDEARRWIRTWSSRAGDGIY